MVKKKAKTHVKTTDLWSLEEDALFLKYVEDPRIACYHAMSRDTSARPGELLAIRIEDIKIKKDANGKIFAEIENVGRYGKTRISRTVPLIKSLPYLKTWLAQHPQGSNPKAYLFVSLENSAKYRNVPLKEGSLSGMYRGLQLYHFSKVLERPDVLPEDKMKIREMLKKPWYPYNRRHTAIDEKKSILNEYDLRQHAGWTKNSKMIEVYTHDLGNESSEDLLLAYGIDVKDHAPGTKQKSALEPITCPYCSEPNKPDAKFCIACKYVLSYDSWNETIQENEQTKKELKELKAKMEAKMDSMERSFEVLIKSCVLDPFIQNGAGLEDEEEKSTTMGQLVRNRRQELMQRERERLVHLRYQRRQWICEKCHTTFDGYRDLRQHMKEAHAY
jgi:hypothetical protein